MPFLYSPYLKNLQKCPSTDYEEKDISLCFRLVYDQTLVNAHNFSPPAIKNPKILNNRPLDQHCANYAVSLHITIKDSRAMFKYYQETWGSEEKVRERFGNFIAQGFLCKKDGVVSGLDANNHFDVHPYKDVELKNKFNVIEPV